MNLRDEILKEHSKPQCMKIVYWVGNASSRFEALLELFMNDEYRVVQRAAWPLSYCVQAHPHLIDKHFMSLVNKLQEADVHNAVKRNIVRLFQYVEIPEAYQGAIMNVCFTFIQSPSEAVAVKAFSLKVLERLAKTYPEILPELKLLIEERWEHETAAFRSRARKIYRKVSL